MFHRTGERKTQAEMNGQEAAWFTHWAGIQEQADSKAGLKRGAHFSESSIYLIKSFSAVPSYLIVSLARLLT